MCYSCSAAPDGARRHGGAPSPPAPPRTQARVASFDYRLAGPDIRYPVPLDDVHAAWRHLRGTTRQAHPVAIGGASASAALALGAVLRERDSGARDGLTRVAPLSRGRAG
ncbi:alpha/beta hydrolase fold domain-containing protein [Rathayibacter rathayi]|uniref:alpha/beta hydrolase fold domain-containing protein n=3 Tax=Rathayibacter rathayi TaxID=33887 RepID=UPI001C66C993